jgi:hypothetical protein
VILTNANNIIIEEIAIKVSSPVTFTAERTGDYICIVYGGNQLVSGDWEQLSMEDVIKSNPQIEIGLTATSYEPYNGNTYTIALGDTYYGATLDVVSGELVVDRAIVTYDGSSSENWSSSEVRPSKFRHMVTLNNGQPNNVAILSNEFKGVPYNSRSYDITGIVWVSGNDNQLVVMSDLNETEFKSLLSSNNLQVVYELATPLTIQLTPTAISTQDGTNNLWADSGDIQSGEYFVEL